VHLDGISLTQRDLSLFLQRYSTELNRAHVSCLSLVRNSLSSLPDELGDLSASLEVLSLEENYLSGLNSTVLTKLGDRLQRLYLQRNHIAVLPESICQLRALRRLFLDRNELRALPAALGSMMNLQWLSVDDNELSTLPVELIECENLEWISVERNHLVSLPDDLASMAYRLRFFSALGNERLVWLPLSMSLLCEQVSARHRYEAEQFQMLHGRAASTPAEAVGLELRIDSVLQIPKSMTHGYPLSNSAMDLHNYQNEHQDRVRDMIFYLERVVLPLGVEFNPTAHYPPQAEVSSLVRCPRSGSKFTFKNTRTHCRLCGNVYAKREVQHRVILAVLGESRVCHYCFEALCEVHVWTRYTQRGKDPSADLKDILDREMRGWTPQEKSLYLATLLRKVTVLVENLVAARAALKLHCEYLKSQRDRASFLMQQEFEFLEQRLVRPVELKRKYGVKLAELQQDPEALDRLVEAAEKEDFDALTRMVREQGLSVDNYHPTRNTTALHAAVARGLVGSITFLLSHNASPNVRIRNNITPYHMAAKRRFLEALKILREAGADITAVTTNGKMALHFLMGQRYERDEELQLCFEECRHMLKAGVDVNGRTEKDETPVHHACMEAGGNEQLLRFLAENHADMNACTSYGLTPLLFAIMSRNEALFRLLHSLGAEITNEVRTNARQVPGIMRYIDPVSANNMLNLHDELRRGFFGHLRQSSTEEDAAAMSAGDDSELLPPASSRSPRSVIADLEEDASADASADPDAAAVGLDLAAGAAPLSPSSSPSPSLAHSRSPVPRATGATIQATPRHRKLHTDANAGPQLFEVGSPAVFDWMARSGAALIGGERADDDDSGDEDGDEEAENARLTSRARRSSRVIRAEAEGKFARWSAGLDAIRAAQEASARGGGVGVGASSGGDEISQRGGGLSGSLVASSAGVSSQPHGQLPLRTVSEADLRTMGNLPAPASRSTEECRTRQGWLFKEAGKSTMTIGGKSVKKWQERYFVLGPTGILSYFRTSRKGVRPAGSINLRTAFQLSASSVRPFAFEIHCPGRVYFCQAKSEKEQQDWMSTIRKYLPRVKSGARSAIPARTDSLIL